MNTQSEKKELGISLTELKKFLHYMDLQLVAVESELRGLRETLNWMSRQATQLTSGSVSQASAASSMLLVPSTYAKS